MKPNLASWNATIGWKIAMPAHAALHVEPRFELTPLSIDGGDDSEKLRIAREKLAQLSSSK